MANEKRAHARLAVPLNARLASDKGEVELSVRDVSRGGIFLYTKTPPGEVGAALTVKLWLPPDGKPLSLKAELVRISMDTAERGGGVLGVGLAFDLKRGQEKQLLELLDSAMQGRGTQTRAYPRVKYLLDVVCRTKSELKALLRDIGEGGVGLSLDRAIPVDEAATVEISRQGQGALSLTGRVVKSEPIVGSPGRHLTGIRFSPLSEEARADLKSFLKKLYHR